MIRPGWTCEPENEHRREYHTQDVVRYGLRLRLYVYPNKNHWHMKSASPAYPASAVMVGSAGDFHGLEDSAERAMEALEGWAEGP